MTSKIFRGRYAGDMMVYKGLCLLTPSLYHDAATSVDMAYGRPEDDLTTHRKHIPSLKRVPPSLLLLFSFYTNKT